MNVPITCKRLILLVNQRVPAREIFNHHTDLSPIVDLEVQSEFFQHLIVISKINPYYVKTVLRFYINLLESKNHEVVEEAYELTCSPNILNAKEMGPSDSDILQYRIDGFSKKENSDDSVVKIKETPKIISGSNTTGLRTWEAALYLANYLNSNEINLAGASILELGAGTGLVGLSLVKYYHQNIGKLKQVVFTDGAAELMDNLSETFNLNNITYVMKELPEIKAHQLLWGTTNKNDDSFIREPSSGIDYLIGADITYDSSVLNSLCSTIYDFFSVGTKCAIIAATIRNEKTINNWEKELEKWFNGNWSKLVCHRAIDMAPNCWFNPNTPEIRIYTISRLAQK